MIGPKQAGTAEVALRFMARRGVGDWTTLVVEPGSQVAIAAEELAHEMESLGDVTVERVPGARDSLDLIERVASARGPLVVAGLDTWEPSEWAHLDQLRSRLARDERTALVVSRPSFEAIMGHAPNFSSWLGASVWSYKPHASELTDDERERRLEALRAWSKLTDADVLARAESGELPPEPEYAEWLVLLRRGDLLER
jgi:hypothetical protein